MRHVSKAVFFNTLACPTLGWWYRTSDNTGGMSEVPLSLAEQFRIAQGTEIGRRARDLHPDGILVEEKNLNAAASRTASLLADGRPRVMFEGTFVVDDYVGKADILHRRKEGWHLTEVKSNVNDKPELLDDLAFTTMVAMRAGVDIASTSLMLVSKDYRLGMPDEMLFQEIDHTHDGLARAVEFADFWDTVRKVTGASKMPPPELRRVCKQCPLFESCIGCNIENHVLEIPRLHQRKLDVLKALSICRIEDMPPDFDLTVNQAIVRDCVISRRPWISANLSEALSTISWPAFYLDFETTMTAIPLYPDTAPYTQMLTQYSIHKCSDVGSIVAHGEYLSDHTRDDRRNLAERLIEDLEGTGSIITYGTFERTMMKDLAMLYPDLAPSLIRQLDRIVDLEAIIRQNFYHPDFHGGTSVKRTLPALVPEMSYDDLEIRDGDSASATFAYLAMGRWREPAEINVVRGNLLRYCERDTLAMVKLHERLYSLSTA